MITILASASDADLALAVPYRRTHGSPAIPRLRGLLGKHDRPAKGWLKAVTVRFRPPPCSNYVEYEWTLMSLTALETKMLLSTLPPRSKHFGAPPEACLINEAPRLTRPLLVLSRIVTRKTNVACNRDRRGEPECRAITLTFSGNLALPRPSPLLISQRHMASRVIPRPGRRPTGSNLE